MDALLVGVCIVALVLFAVARSIFGRANAVLLAGAVGYGLGGPPGGGTGLVIGLVMSLIAEAVRAAIMSGDA